MLLNLFKCNYQSSLTHLNSFVNQALLILIYVSVKVRCFKYISPASSSNLIYEHKQKDLTTYADDNYMGEENKNVISKNNR